MVSLHFQAYEIVAVLPIPLHKSLKNSTRTVTYYKSYVTVFVSVLGFLHNEMGFADISQPVSLTIIHALITRFWPAR